MKLAFLAVLGAGRLRRAPPIDLTVDEAKEAVPPAVKSAFAEAMSTKDSAAVLSSMAELSELYATAQADFDESTIACKNHKERFKKDVQIARLAWNQLQSQVTLTMTRMATAQAGVARAETEIETYRNHHVSLTKTCASKQADASALLEKLDADMPVAQAIVTEAMASCDAGGEAASLLTCAVDGNFYTTFADDGLRDLVTNMSVPSEQFMSLALTRSAKAATAAALISAHRRHHRTQLRGKGKAQKAERKAR